MAEVKASEDGARPDQPEGVPQSAGPVVSNVAGDLNVFAVDTAREMWRIEMRAGTWGEASPIGGPAIAPPSATTRGRELIELFMLGPDSAVYRKVINVFEPPDRKWTSLGRPRDCALLGRPEPVSFGEERVDVFALGTDSRLHRCRVFPEASPWEPVRESPLLRRPPTTVPWWSHADLFATDVAGEVHHLHYPGDEYGQPYWTPLGAPVSGEQRVSMTRPGAARSAYGPLVVFALDPRQGSYCNWQDGPGGEWSGWVDMGGQMRTVTDGAGVFGSPDAVDVVAVNPHSSLFHRWPPDSGTIWGHQNLGTPANDIWCAGRPQFVSWGWGRLDVFVLCTDAGIHHTTYQGTGGGGWSWSPFAKVALPSVVAF